MRRRTGGGRPIRKRAFLSMAWPIKRLQEREQWLCLAVAATRGLTEWWRRRPTATAPRSHPAGVDTALSRTEDAGASTAHRATRSGQAPSLPSDIVQQQIRRIVEDMLVADETPLSRQEREDLVREVQHETFGLGPIEPLMQDPTVSDIRQRAHEATQSVAASSSGRTRSSATTPISCRSSTASYRPWAVGSTNRP